MIKFSSISWRYPLLAVLLVTAVSLLMAVSFIYRDYKNLQQNLVQQAYVSGSLLSNALSMDLNHDDLWKVYYLLNRSTKGDLSIAHVEQMVIVDNMMNVYTSTQPDYFPYGLAIGTLSPAFEKISQLAQSALNERYFIYEDALQIYINIPIYYEDKPLLGFLIMKVSKQVLTSQIHDNVANTLIIWLISLVFTIPIAWFWGRGLAQPLAEFTQCIKQARQAPSLGCKLPADKRYTSIEMKALRAEFSALMHELHDKELLKNQIIASEKLAALGRLGAGLAHEINNPLGGMLNAISTYKKHANHSQNLNLLEKTLGLLERGLLNIQSLTKAFLVDLKTDSPRFSPLDAEDVRLLVDFEVQKRQIDFHWRNYLDDYVNLPSNLIRQLLINLLINAINHTEPNQMVRCFLQVRDEPDSASGSVFEIEIENYGTPIPKKVMENIFEPFPDGRTETGHGLGLWVVFQIVQKLNGEIRVKSDDFSTMFRVTFPTNSYKPFK